MVSVLVFGSLIACNYLLVGAEQEKMQLLLIADQEDAVYNQGTMLMGASLLDLLDRLQMRIVAVPLPCSGIAVPLSRLVRGASVMLHQDDGASANVTARMVEDGVAYDNITSLQPFMGSLPGFLDVEARASIRVDPVGGSVMYSKTETHHLYLPIDVAGVVSFCEYSVGRVAESVKTLGGEVCNSTRVRMVFEDLRSQLSGRAFGPGFALSISYWASARPLCSVGFSVQVTQQNVEGPLGPFAWSVDESGSVTS